MRVDRNHRRVVAVDQLRQLHALAQHELGEMDELAQTEVQQIDLDELGQVLRQAQHLDVVAQVGDHAALRLDAHRGSLVGEVQGHAHADLLVLVHPLEVDVKDLALPRVALHILEHRSLLLVAGLQVQDGGVETLLVEHLHQLGVVDREGAGRLVTTVDDRRDLAGTTQAAARTLALVVPELHGEFE